MTTVPSSVAGEEPAEREQRGIQSVEVGGQLLLALADTGRPMALKDLARAAGMSPAKAHPYLVSFGKLGLIVQEEGSGRYGLGPLALQLGLISLQQFDPVRLAMPVLRELAQSQGHTMAVAVWGNRGPTIVRIEEAPSPVHVNMRHGTVMSLRGTASGMLFAAHLERSFVEAALATERAIEARLEGRASVPDGEPLIDAGLEREWASIRRHGISRIEGGAIPGVSALSAPVFDESGALVLGLTAIGPSAILDTRLDSPVIAALKRAAKALSRQLGAPEAG